MPNLHSHAFQRAMAGLAEVAGTSDDSFWTWREQMHRLVERLSPDDVEAITAAAKDDEAALDRIAAEVRDLLASYPAPGWDPRA